MDIPCEAKNLLDYLKKVSPLTGPSVLSELAILIGIDGKEVGFEDFEVLFPDLRSRGKNRILNY